jgi:hypothetical protein
MRRAKCIYFSAVVGLIFSLAACGGEASTVSVQQYSLPNSNAIIVVEKKPFGGGAGAADNVVSIKIGTQSAIIAKVRSLYPVRVRFSVSKQTLTIWACIANISKNENTSIMPYGELKPMYITTINDGNCGYRPFPTG